MSREYIASVLKRLRAEQGMTADEVGEIIGKEWKDRERVGKMPEVNLMPIYF